MHNLNRTIPGQSSRIMREEGVPRWFAGILVFLFLLVPLCLFAQEENQGKVGGNYVVTQSIEVGTRMVEVHGNNDTYESMAGLHGGPRLLEQSLTMRSLNHTGTLFDQFWMRSFGYGGDPERGTRLRVYKNHWYDFDANYRRDINSFNYNLLANPMVPANIYAPNSGSPHWMATTRNMGDFRLTVAPQSRLRLRLGYSRNVNEGPASTSYHEGTEIQLLENYRNRSDRYQLGADWKLAPRTQLSYDFFFDHNKVDTTAFDANVDRREFNVNGIPADLGIIYDPFNAQPCANTPTPIVGATGSVKPTCNFYLYYSRSGPSRSDFPTSQISLVSNYWKRIDVSFSGSYSSGQSEMTDFNEVARAYISRTNETAFNVTGPALVDRRSSNVDAALTYRIAEQWSVTNQIRFLYWRIPAMWNSSETICYANLPPGGANPATILTPSGPTTPGATECLEGLFSGNLAIPVTATPSVLTTSSSGNLINEQFVYYYGQRTLSDTTLLEFTPSRRFGAHIGFRYGDRVFTAKDDSSSTTVYYPYNLWNNNTLTSRPAAAVTSPPAGEVHSSVIHERALLTGVLLRPVDLLRISADLEYVNNDNALTRIAPLRLTIFRGRVSYQWSPALSLSGSMNLRQGSNDKFPAGFITSPEQPHRDHSRGYNANASYSAKQWLTLDLGYSYADIYSNTSTCLPVSSRPSVISAQGGVLDYCYDPAIATPTPATGDYSVVVRYKERTNTGYLNVAVRPVKRVSVNLGYDIANSSGSDDFLRADTLDSLLLQQSRVQAGGLATVFVPYNPNVPAGPIAINYHRPSIGASVQVSRGIFLKGDYAYYGYNEKSPATPAGVWTGTDWIGVPPRDFHANTGSVSVRYQF